MAYVKGAMYLRNKNTGAVFPYRPRIAHFPGLVKMVAEDENTLADIPIKVPQPELNPTDTPDKEPAKASVAKPAPPKSAKTGAGTPVAKTPTMAPVETK